MLETFHYYFFLYKTLNIVLFFIFQNILGLAIFFFQLKTFPDSKLKKKMQWQKKYIIVFQN